MRNIQKLLVPVDFSPESKRALQYGLALATQIDGELIALHVIEDPPENESLLSFTFPPEIWPFFDAQHDRRPLDRLLRERALDLWNFLDSTIEKSTSATVKRLVRVGSLREEIIAAARQENIDMIILELRNRFLFPNRARRKLLKIIDRLPYPVLLAPPHSEETPVRGEPLRLFHPVPAESPA
jgi:nucleotide-binding universal stress UspA family protein